MSLTTPPTNLKEAIDWVIKISTENGAIKGLAEELLKLLDKDAKDVAEGVLRVMGKSLKGVVEGLKKSHSQIPSRGLQGYLSNSKTFLDTVSHYGTAVPEQRRKTFIKWLEKDATKGTGGPISTLADGLKKFIGYQGNGKPDSTGIIKSRNSYQSAYDGKQWSDVEDQKNVCAKIFLGVAPLIFYLLPFLYWKCKLPANEDCGWKEKNLNHEPLQKFMGSEAIGFKAELHESKKGSHVTTLIGSTCFKEIETAYEQGKKEAQKNLSTKTLSMEPYYATVIRHLEQSATSKPSPSTSPLSCCFAIASPFFTPNPLYIVEFTSPATPSFLGYSGLSTLAGGAYGFNLGGLGTLMSALLASPNHQVKKLLQGLEKSESNIGEDIKKVKEALGTDQNGLIAKLAEGLQQFIGYKQGGNGIIEASKGIAVSNLPVERLRDAVLGFIAEFLGQLKSLSDLKTRATQISKAITALNGGIGQGKDGFDKALQEVETALGQVSGLSSGIQQVVNAVKKVSQLRNQPTGVRHFASKVKDYFNGVLQQVEKDNEVKRASRPQELNTKVQTLKTQLGNLVTNVGSQNDAYPINVGDSSSNGQQNGLKNDIDTIYKAGSGSLTQLRKAFISLPQKTASFALSAATHTATTAFVTVLQTDYTSYYKGATWNQVSGDGNHKTCAKIFLACLPLIFNGLSYFYWKCSHDKGWKTMTLGSPEPKAFMGFTSIGANRVKSGRKGSEILSQAFGRFKEFQTAANGSTTSYADFLKKFKGNCLTTWQGSSSANDNFLSGLYLCSTSYFRHQHQKKAATARSPSSIREMLYWLMGLTVTPQFGDLLGHIDSIVPKTGLQVAVSGSSKKDEKLFADDVAGHLITTCFTATPIFSTIQGTGDSSKPWLHELFATAGFTFAYPTSGPALFSNVSNYAYALQFQLSFLYIQCRNTYTVGCGWNQCTFGQGINESSKDTVVASHICSVGCTNTGHNPPQNHSTGCEHNGCGKAGKPSPLQAFLTDKLKGFSRGHPSDPSSHLTSCSGTVCHVPMGFDGHLKGNKKTGGNLYNALGSFCGGFNTPLPQLSEKLGCLTKRTPRTLGDMFGFTWHLKGQLSATLNNITKAEWLRELKDKLPFSYQLTDDSGENLKKFVGSDHSAHQTSPADLTALHSSRCDKSDKTCGPYLYPLTHSDAATFGKPAPYASTYLSWMVYLTDDTQSGFQEFLDEFKNIDCSKTGCRYSTKTNPCSKPHQPGTHGTSAECKCESVVHCGGVLPLLYRHGFRFLSAFRLKGVGNGGDQSKRTCKAFTDQLQSVISGNPLSNLLTSIDEFLFLFRYYFLSNLSGFWTIYTGLILYTFFFLLDTLHVRSHLKLTSSHTVPPLALLTSGKPLPITKLSYIGQ
ncbi:variant erythrocyte surface antigen-1 family protein [Babesia caballi]|uniref:Variant erythrocyte surface antigen-1 family protein n=1 Tax=Babesia caballi TaxID=5871 RepID=A0AAV4LTX7_BABCB|nr:variant erythrocyte surface antigen-1 family protein [Babesia caballi]